MEASLTSFQSGLDGLKHYIKTLDYQSKLFAIISKDQSTGNLIKLTEEYKSHVAQSIGSLKKFEYNTIVVSLYGILEQFVESIITAYVYYLNDVIPHYDSLPEQLKKHHLDLSIALINRKDLQQYKGKISPKKIISNINSCYDDTSQYIINAEAYSQHTANFKAEIIDTVFSRVGINKISDYIRQRQGFFTYLNKRYLERQIDKMKPDTVFYHLNDLAERRNQVAHGVISDEIASKEILAEYIEFFEAYGPALHEVVYRHTLPFLALYKGVEIGQPIAVYDNSIVCFEFSNIKISTDTILIAKPANSSSLYRKGQIQSLQVDGKNYNELSISEPLKFGAKVNFKAKDNQTFFLLTNK